MTEYRVTVYLSQEPRTLLARSAQDFLGALDCQWEKEAYTLIADCPSPEAAAEVAFAVCNSYPTELHCPTAYRDDVILYRAAGHRSLSVGDVVKVGRLTGVHDERWYGCASMGWLPLPVGAQA